MGTTEQIQAGPEVHFAQRLAANEKKTRDRAIKRLRRWLHIRSASDNVFTKDDMMKIWKGLFYCMWMQDKPLIQEDLATCISELIHCFNTKESAFLFVECFFHTMAREWYGIDNWRIDKFMMFARRFIGQCFLYLIKYQLEPELISAWNEVLERSVVNSKLKDVPMGLQYHLSDIYVEELTKNGVGELPPDKASVLLEPYCKLLVETEDPTLLENVKVRVFHYAMKIADLDDEEMEEEEGKDCNGVDTTGENIEDEDNLEEAVDPENNDESTTEIVKKKKKKKKSKYRHTNYRALVRRMEKEALYVPYLRFDCKTLGDRLFSLGSQKHIKQRNRIVAYDLQKKFKDLSEGVFPLKMPKMHLEKDLSDDDFEEAAINLMKFEEKLIKKNNEMKQKHQLAKKRKYKGDNDISDDDDVDDEFSELCLDDNEEDEELDMMIDTERCFDSKMKNNQKKKKDLKANTLKNKEKAKKTVKKRKTNVNAFDTDSVNNLDEGIPNESRISEMEDDQIVKSDETEQTEAKQIKRRKKIKKKNKNQALDSTNGKNDLNESVHIVDADRSTTAFPVCKLFSSGSDNLKEKEEEEDLEFSLPPAVNKNLLSTTNTPEKIPLKKVTSITDVDSPGISAKVVNEQISELDDSVTIKLNETNLNANQATDMNVKKNNSNSNVKKETVMETTSIPDSAPKKNVKQTPAKKQKLRKFANRYFNEKLSKTHLSEKKVTEFPVSVKAKKQGFSKHRNFISMEKSEKPLPKQLPSVSPEQIVAFQKIMKTPPAFVRKAVEKVSSSKKKAPKSVFGENINSVIKKSKRVNFNISNNAVQEIKDYHNTLKLSPGVPFDGKKKPSQGVLKTTPTSGK